MVDRRLTIVKIGGNVIDDDKALGDFLNEFVKIKAPKILVHGGGKMATQLCSRLGIETEMIEGRRVTNRETLDVTTMVYAGLLNKQIVAKLNALGCCAIGMSGADANIIPAIRRNPVPVDYGYVGDIDSSKINRYILTTFIDKEITPVFCPITHDNKGNLLNSNADGVASAIAVASSAIMPVRLIYCFEKNGVLSDINDEDSVIETIGKDDFELMKATGVISKGMIPKISSALKAIENGVSSVEIKHPGNINNEVGTIITS